MTTTTPVCESFVPAPGGAHKWCDTCGWRRDYHRKRRVSLFAPCPPHFLFPLDADDPTDERMRCEKCEVVLDPADVEPEALATGRGRQQAEDEFTKGATEEGAHEEVWC